MSRFARRCMLVVFVGLAGAFPVAAWAQNRDVFKDSPAVRAAFRKVVDQARHCVVEVLCQGEADEKPVNVAMGTIVGADGWIVTKASELRGRITCKLGEKGAHAARLVGVSTEFDLAMLKIDVSELPTATWDESAKPNPGQWVATASMNEDPLAVGVVSVVRRAIPSNPGLLGILLQDPAMAKVKTDAPRIDRVDDGSAAKKAGLKVGDLVTHVNGKPMATSDQLIRTIRGFQAGTVVKLTIRRGEEYLNVEATLQSRPAPFQDQLGQTLSKRSSGFPAALQHDTVLKPSQCGGPIVGLHGKVLGLNIARAGRVVSYAIPSDSVVGLLADLKSGKLAPPPEILAALTQPHVPLEAPAPKSR